MSVIQGLVGRDTSQTSAQSSARHPAAANGQSFGHAVQGTQANAAPAPTPTPTPGQTPNDPNQKTAPTKAQIDEAQASIRKDADGYTPAAPKLTVNDGVASALTPMLKAQRQLEAHQQNHADVHQVDTARATIAGANALLYAEQQKIDRQKATASSENAKRALSALNKMLPGDIALKPGQMLNEQQLSGLNTSQQAAYGSYALAQAHANSDQAKVQADGLAAMQNYAQLQVYKSDPQKYGTAADDAVSKINEALKSQGIQLTAPKVLDKKAAQQNLDKTNQAARLYAANWNYATASVATLTANGSNSRANDDAALACTYLNKLQGQQAVLDAQNKLAQANAVPGNQRDAAVARAQSELTLARQRADACESTFVGAYAQRLAAEKIAKASSKDATPAARGEARAVQMVANTLSVNAGEKTAVFQHAVAQNNLATVRQAGGSGSGSAGNGVDQAGQELAAAQYHVLAATFNKQMTEFLQSLPANLQDPHSEADNQAFVQAHTAFFQQHQSPLSDPLVAQQFAGLAAGQKVDVEAAIREVKQDLDQEERSINHRSWLHSTGDWVRSGFGGNRSDVESYLKNELKSLQDLEAQQGQMGTSAYNGQYLKVMGNFSTQFEQLSQAEHRSDHHWDVATEIARGALATAVGVGVTVLTGGNVAAGALAGFATYQAFDAVQDIKTAVTGGNIADNAHISLVGLGIDAFNGKLSWGETGHFALDASVELVSSLANAGGAVAAKSVSAWAASKAIPAVLSKVAPSLASGLETAASTATRAEVALVVARNTTQSLTVNATQSLTVRALSTGVAASANQVFQAGGQLITTGVNVAAQGQFNHEGAEAMIEEGKNQAFYLAAAPLVAPLSGALPANRMLVQIGADFGTNALQSEVHALVVDHHNMTADDWLAAAITAPTGALQRVVENPRGIPVIESMFKRRPYTEINYKQLYETAEPELKALLPKPGSIQADEMTLRLAHEVPGGLEDIVADIHAHFLNYGRVVGDQFGGLLTKAGEFALIHLVGIAEFCGGFYYADFNPSPATVKNVTKLDVRLGKRFMRAVEHEPALAAKADPSLIGFDFSKDGKQHPINYAKERLLEFPGVFASAGELTAQKEGISILKGRHGWTVANPKFRAFLKSAADETGQAILIHNDWGGYGTDSTGRPAGAKTDYRHFKELVKVLGEQQYRKAKIILAHTGIGRYVRPNDAPITKEVTVVRWDWEKNRPKRTETKTITAPEHIHKLYELFEKVPNARADVSWNDVTQAYADNPALRKGLVDFVIDNQDRLLFGSDTVKPASKGQYQQTLTTGLPIFAEIARRDPVAAWKLLRGNYEDTMNRSRRDVVAWTRKELTKQATKLERAGGPDGAKQAEEVRRKIQAMDDMVGKLGRDRQEMLRQATERYDQWLTKLKNQPGMPAGTTLTPGVFPALYATLEPLPHEHSGVEEAGDFVPPKYTSQVAHVGTGTSGGKYNDSPARRKVALYTTIAAPVGMALLDIALVHSAATAGLVDPTLHAGPAALNAGAFAERGALLLRRMVYLEQLRDQWETIFEKGSAKQEGSEARNLTRDRLDKFVGRIVSAAPHLEFSPEQITRVSAATEQLWANFDYLNKLPVDEARGWTEQQKDHAIMAKIGEYQITVDRELGGQASSISMLDGKMPWGELFRAATLLTYGVNDAVTASWLAHGHADFSNPAAAADTMFRILFGLGNAAMTAHTAGSMFRGMLKISDTSKHMRWLLTGGMGALTLGGGFWTTHDGITFANHFVNAFTGNPHALTTVAGFLNTGFDAAFTLALGKTTFNEYKRITAGPMDTPGNLATPVYVYAGALVLREMMALAQQYFQDDDEKKKRGANPTDLTPPTPSPPGDIITPVPVQPSRPDQVAAR